MNLRVRISYRDAADCSEFFSDYDRAARFVGVMDRLWSGQIVESAIEQQCDTHGWEHIDDIKCDRCSDVAGCTNDLDGDDRGEFRLLCTECQEQVAEDRAGECSCGYFCADCTGIPNGPL
jgi:hypothetical protein